MIATSALIELPDTTISFNSQIPEPFVYQELSQTLELGVLQNTIIIPQKDNDLRLGNNFASIEGLHLEKTSQ